MIHKYNELRDNITEGSVAFYSSDGIVGNIISSLTGSQFSHVGIVCFGEVGDGGKSVLLSESNELEGKTRLVPLSGRLPFAFLPLNSSGKFSEEARDLCKKIDGTEYAYDYLFYRLLGMTPELSDTHKYCSLHVAGILSKCGFGYDDMVEGGRSPGELLESLQKDHRFGDLKWVGE